MVNFFLLELHPLLVVNLFNITCTLITILAKDPHTSPVHHVVLVLSVIHTISVSTFATTICLAISQFTRIFTTDVIRTNADLFVIINGKIGDICTSEEERHDNTVMIMMHSYDMCIKNVEYSIHT